MKITECVDENYSALRSPILQEIHLGTMAQNLMIHNKYDFR